MTRRLPNQKLNTDQTHIKRFETWRMNGDTYTLDFFVYVVGDKVTGLKNLRNITDETGVRDSFTYARDLFNLTGRVRIQKDQRR